MRKLYWIDDGIEGVRQLADKIIFYLWGLNEEEHIVSQMLIFKRRKGSSRLKELILEMEQNIESDVEQLVDNRARNYLAGKDTDDYTETKRWKKDYLEGKFKCALYNEKDENLNELYEQLVSYWGSPSGDIITEQHIECMNKYINSLSLDNDSVIGIDICLFSTYDRNKVINDKPVLAYYLYKELKDRGHQCFLYSLDLDTPAFADSVKHFLQTTLKYKDGDIKLYITEEIIGNGKSEFLNDVREMCRKEDMH